jgi:hypothetical protein
LTAHIDGRTWAKGVQKYGAEECIWAYDGEGDGELHNEELHVFYSLPSIIQVIQLRIMGWTVG